MLLGIRAKMSRHVLAVLVCLPMAAAVHAGIRGTVSDHEGQPLAGASVVAYQSDNSILAFATADGDGHYSIEKVMGGQAGYLLVRMLGFKTEKVDLAAAGETMDVTLYPDNVTLKEVVVKATPIRQYSDTTQYVVAAFSDGCEKNLEELLTKLPGISVGDNGNISFRGKPVSKILLDQADMFGANYKIASKTIPPQFVSTIEAISHYQENRQLKDVQASDDVVLNLSLRSDMKLQKPVGRIYLGGGVEGRYDLGGNMMSMNKKVKCYGAVALSNIAASALSSQDDTEELPSVEVVTDYFHSFDNRDNVRYVGQRSKSNSLNLICQPVSALTLGEHLIVEESRYATSSREVIRYADGLTGVDRMTRLKSKPFSVDNRIDAKYDWGAATTLDFKNRLAYRHKRVDNQFVEELVTDYGTRTNSRLLENSISLSHAFPNKSALVVDAVSVLGNGNQVFDYGTAIHQSVDADRRKNSVVAKYLRRLKSMDWNVGLGYEDYKDKLWLECNGMSRMSAKASERLLFVQPRMSWGYRDVRVQLGMVAGWWFRELTATSIGKSIVRSLKVVPDIAVDLDMNKHHFSLASTYEPQETQTLDYLAHYSDDRQLSLSATSYNHKMADWGITSSYMFMPSLSTMLMAMYMYTLSENSFIYDYRVTQDQEVDIPVALGSNRRHLAMLSASQYCDALRHGIRLSVNYNSMDYKNVMETLCAVNSTSLTSKLSVRSSFGGAVNYMAGGRYSLSSYRREGHDRVSAHNHSFFQELSFKLGGLRARIAFDEHFLGKDRNFYFFVSPDVRYEWKKYNATLALSAYNVLNHKRLHEYMLTDIYSREYEQSIVPAYYLLSISLRY